jgi:hypothetical protein
LLHHHHRHLQYWLFLQFQLFRKLYHQLRHHLRLLRHQIQLSTLSRHRHLHTLQKFR